MKRGIIGNNRTANLFTIPGMHNALSLKSALTPDSTLGAFNDKFIRSEEMVKLVRGKLKEMGYGPIKRWFFSSHIPQLERWEK